MTPLSISQRPIPHPTEILPNCINHIKITDPLNMLFFLCRPTMDSLVTARRALWSVRRGRRMTLTEPRCRRAVMVINDNERLWKRTTGWSKETVDCNLFLTDPIFLKSAITQWFLESLYREVLVFWCFKSVRCVEFCLSEIFKYGHLLHHTRP